nr:MAG TPA: minor tail protein [Caudoviricetes sp.]
MAKEIKFKVKLSVDGKEQLVSATTTVADLRKVTQSAREDAARLRDELLNYTQSVQAIQSVAGAFSSLAGVLNSVTDESRAFGGAMRVANTMAGKDAAGFEKLKGQVSELSKQIPIARDALANGLYQVVSNGVPEDNWLSFLGASAKSSVGGVADLGEVVKVTSTIVKNYGLDWAEAQDIQDKIQLTAKNGVTSFEQLAQALPSVTGQAAQLGVSLDEMLAVMSTLTGVTGNTSEVSTQLGSVLTALTKETEKSQQMAKEMGISFNAASVQAAGGLRNFLQDLDKSVTAYASKSGQLKESIYAKLFGRSEAMRMVNALTGQLQAKFDENISAMQNSAGTMENAFSNVANTGSAELQKLTNRWAGVGDAISNCVRRIQPFLNFGSQFGMTVTSIAAVTLAFKRLHVAQNAASVALKIRDYVAYGFSATRAAAANRILAGSLNSVAAQATAAKLAMRSFLASTAIGVVLVAAGAAIAYFMSKADEAEEKVNEFSDAEDAFKTKAGEVKVALDGERKKLEGLIKAKKDAHKEVDHLNKTYGEVFGQHKTAAEWYDILTRKSKIYAKQLGYEAKVRVLSSRLAEAEIALEDNYMKRRELWNSGKARRAETHAVVDTQTDKATVFKMYYDTKEYTALKNAAKGKPAEIKRLQAELESATKQFSITSAELNMPLPTGGKGKGGKGKGGKGKKPVANPKTLEELNTNIDYYKSKIATASDAEKEKIRANIQIWQKKKDAIELAQKAAERPLKIETLEDTEKEINYLQAARKLATKDQIALYDKQIAKVELLAATMQRPETLQSLQDVDKEVQYQQKLRATASKEQIGAIDKEIKRLSILRNHIENAETIEMPDEALRTFDQLNAKLSYYNELLQRATTEERGEIQKHISDLEAIKKTWDEALATMRKPADISALSTLAQLDEAIRYYQDVQQRQTEEEISNTQRVINALEKKRAALQRSVDLPKMQAEVGQIQDLPEREMKIKIRAIGVEALTEKVRELKTMLADAQNPLTDEQRKAVEGLISTYNDWREESISTFGEIRKGWSGIEGIAEGITTLSSILESNANAWQVISGVVNAFFSIMDGFSKIVDIVNAFTIATEGSAAATAASAIASTASAAATTADASASIANTAAKSGEAVAEATKSGAKLPFPTNLIAIGAGVAAVVAALALIGRFEKGGIVGGNSPTGDKLLARVNSGEMILNKNQQHNLWKMINAPRLTYPKVVTPKLQPNYTFNATAVHTERETGGNFRFEVEGRKLVAVLSNETRLASKSGRRSNIIG